MINDNIDHLSHYAIPKTKEILQFISDHDCINLPDCEIEIDGRHLFVRIMSYKPKKFSENRFEIHHVYADVQYVVNGAELMQTARIEDLIPLTDYDSKNDCRFFQPLNNAFTDTIVNSHEFAFFHPQEAHRPSCIYQGYSGFVKKMVFKVKIN